MCGTAAVGDFTTYISPSTKFTENFSWHYGLPNLLGRQFRVSAVGRNQSSTIKGSIELKKK